MKFIIADDHAIVREGVIYSLKNHFGDETEVLEAEDSASLIALLENNNTFDLILLDLMMPGSKGLSLLKRICNDWPEQTVAVLSASENSKDMRKSIDYGAAGFIPKSLAREVMISAIRLVLVGGVYVPTKGFMSTAADVADRIEKNVLLEADGSIPLLTDRQRQVLIGIARGKTNRDIGNELELSEYTIKIHVTAIFKKLKVSNRMQSVLIAKELGLFEADDLIND